MKNPLTDGMPKLLTKTEFVEKFFSLPDIKAEGSIEERLFNVRRVRSQFKIPQKDYYYFYSRVLSLNNECLEMRTPKWLVQKFNDKSLTEEEFTDAIEDEIRNANTVFVTYISGVAGTGKTLAVNFLTEQFPRRIYRKEINRIQVPIVKIQAPSKSTRKDLCDAIIADLSKSARKDYKAESKYLNENRLTEFVKTILLIHCVGILIIDEFQDLRINKEKGPNIQTLAFVKKLTNSLCIVLVIVGSPEIEDILFGDFQLSTRSQGFTWDRFPPGSQEYNYFMKNLFSRSVLDEISLNDTLSEVFYDFSQGVARIIVELYMEAQVVALHFNSKSLEKTHVLIAFKTLFKGIDHPMKGIMDNNHFILSKYPDLKGIKNYSHQYREENEKDLPAKIANKQPTPSSEQVGIQPVSLNLDKYMSNSLLALASVPGNLDGMYSTFINRGYILPLSTVFKKN